MKLPFKIISRYEYAVMSKGCNNNYKQRCVVDELAANFRALTKKQLRQTTSYQLKNILKRFGVVIEPVHKHTKSLNTKERKAIMNYMNSCKQTEENRDDT